MRKVKIERRTTLDFVASSVLLLLVTLYKLINKLIYLNVLLCDVVFLVCVCVCVCVEKVSGEWNKE